MRLMVEADVRGPSAETFDAIFGKSLLDYWNCLLKFHVGSSVRRPFPLCCRNRTFGAASAARPRPRGSLASGWLSENSRNQLSALLLNRHYGQTDPEVLLIFTLRLSHWRVPVRCPSEDDDVGGASMNAGNVARSISSKTDALDFKSTPLWAATAVTRRPRLGGTAGCTARRSRR